jgi:drug/metabolite transporter (DMT)-like permease
MSRGLRYMAASAFCFSVMSVLVRVAGRHLPSQEIVLVRGVITLVLSWVALRRAGLPMWGTKKGLLILRGTAGFLALSCYYYAVTHLPLADATVLHFTNPVMTVLLASVVLGEKLRGRELALTALCLAGVVLVARPPFLFGAAAAPFPPLAVAIALCGALGSAVAYVTVRAIGQSENPLVVVFYFPLVTVPATLPFVIGNLVWPHAIDWLLLVGIGISTQLGQLYLTRGLQLEPAGRATAVGYLQVALAYVFGIVLFAEHPSLWSTAGAVLVLAGIVALGRGRDPNAPPSSPELALVADPGGRSPPA